jgi:hypothetical protein
MTHGFSIGEALADGFRLIRRRPLGVFAWGALLTVPLLLSMFLMIDLMASLGLDAMTADEPGPQAYAAIMRLQALSGLLNVLQLGGYVLIVAAVCRAVLWPERAPGRFFDLRIGMDEARVAVAGLAVLVGFYGVMVVILMLAFAFGAALWMVSEAAAVILGVLVGVSGLIGAAWAALRASMILPASVALKDFAFVTGWKMTQGRVSPLLGLFVAMVAIAILIQVLVMTVAALIALGLSIPFWPQLAAWAAGAQAGSTPPLSSSLIVTLGIAVFPMIALYYGVVTVIMTAPYVSACRQMLAARDETSMVEVS